MTHLVTFGEEAYSAAERRLCAAVLSRALVDAFPGIEIEGRHGSSRPEIAPAHERKSALKFLLAEEGRWRDKLEYFASGAGTTAERVRKRAIELERQTRALRKEIEDRERQVSERKREAALNGRKRRRNGKSRFSGWGFVIASEVICKTIAPENLRCIWKTAVAF